VALSAGSQAEQAPAGAFALSVMPPGATARCGTARRDALSSPRAWWCVGSPNTRSNRARRTRRPLTSLTCSTSAVASLAADAPIGTDGQITIYNRGNVTDVIADITGYCTPAADGPGEMYHAVNPTRLVDTRNGTGSSTGKAGQVLADSTCTVSQADTQQVATAPDPTLATMLTSADSTATATSSPTRP
jgi:hypothetical protein